jgi:tripartite ATP-independent transporter DctM subunit
MLPLGRGFGWLLSGLNGLGTVWIFVMMVLINADVLSRALFNLPISGVPLVISLSIIAIVFLQLPDALRNGRMTRNEVVLSRLEAKGSAWAHILHALFHLAGLATMVVVCIYGYPLFVKAWNTGAYYGNLGDFTFAEWPIKLIVLIGAASCGLQFLVHAARDLYALSAAGGRSELAKFAIVTAAAVAAILALRYGLSGMSAVNVGFLSVLFMLVLVYLGLHVGIALAIVAFFCVLIIRDSGSLSGTMLALAANESLRQYELGVIPLFVLMGMFVAISDVGKDAFAVADRLFRRLRGGLGTATVIANAIFAAITGTSIASASVFTKIAVPEMLNAGYKSRFAVGVVAGSSVLGMLIPPSLLMIIFGILAETSIGDLFIAGIVPGIVLSIAYSILIWVMATYFPRSVYASGAPMPAAGATGARYDAGTGFATTAPRHDPGERRMSGSEMLLRIGPIMGLIVLILAGIYGGIFTATEAGGVGAALAGLIALARRKLTLASLWRVLVETGYVTASICFLLVAAHLYARMISVSGIPGTLEHGITAAGLGYWGVIAAYLVVIIILGTILDAGSIMLITVPIVVPTMLAMQAAGVDIGSMIWFGIITVIAVEIGLLTPPVGLACFAIHSNLNDRRISLNDVFWGSAPFAVVMVIVLLLVVAFPWLALALL